jgi:hypothetical protein
MENLSEKWAMGGFGSGRYGGRPTVESGLALDINRLIRQRWLVPGACTSGALTWSNTVTGKDVASIGYTASMVDPDDAWVKLRYLADDVRQDYRVPIASTPCHYGGRRWWWKCPRSGRRVAKLYLPPGEAVFAARRAYGLAYHSQRMTALDRSHDRQRRLYRKLGARYEYFEQVPPPRPRGMHRGTYERLEAGLCDAMERHNQLFALAAAPILARLKKADMAASDREMSDQ